MLINFDHYFERSKMDSPLNQSQLSQILRQLASRKEALDIQPLSGGYLNQNYRISFRDSSLLLRVASNPDRASLENHILQSYAHQLPLPVIHSSKIIFNKTCTLMSFVKGTLPCHLSKNSSHFYQLGQSIGEVLALIHHQRFREGGFFAPDLSLAEPFGNQGRFWLDYMYSVLAQERSRQRLGNDLTKNIKYLLKTHEALLLNLTSTNCLVHSDFNLKNMLVIQKDDLWHVSAILDWEFAHAGSPLCDIANFLRFEEVLPEDLITGFIQTYQERSGNLSDNWRQQAYLLDLASMCNLIERSEVKNITFKTVKQVMNKTLKAFQ